MNASIIIPTFNRPASLEPCLRPLLREFQENRLTAEIIVIDDASEARNAEQVDELIHLLASKQINLERHGINQGCAVARNTGVARAQGHVLIFIDDDLIPSPTFIQDHVEIHRAHPHIQMLCGHLHTKRRSIYARHWSHCYDHVFCKDANGRELYPVHMVSGGNHSVKRTVLSCLHPLFDPYLRSREDFDLYLRATDAGFTVYKTIHASAELEPCPDFATFYRQKRWYAGGEARLHAKHGKDKVIVATSRYAAPLTPDLYVLAAGVRVRKAMEEWPISLRTRS